MSYGRRRFVSRATYERREAARIRESKRLPAFLRLEGPVPSDRDEWKTVAEGNWNDRECVFTSRLDQAPSGAYYVWEALIMGGWRCTPVVLEGEIV